MKSIKNILLIGLAGFLFSAAAMVKNTYLLAKDHDVSIHGTSNLHEWNEKVETVSGIGEVNWNIDGSFDLTAINIKIDVHSIKSDMGSIMNNNTYKALKADANPQIVFTLSDPIKSILAKSASDAITVKGNLSIAGVTRSVAMQVKVFMQDHNRLAFEGTQKIKMTDFGVIPPTALMGTLKTGDDISIHYKTSFIINNK